MNISKTANLAQTMVDVVVVIDAVYDCMNKGGLMAQNYGIESCQPLFDLKSTLKNRIRHKKRSINDID